MNLWGYSKWKYFLLKPRNMVKNTNELRAKNFLENYSSKKKSIF